MVKWKHEFNRLTRKEAEQDAKIFRKKGKDVKIIKRECKPNTQGYRKSKYIYHIHTR